MRQKSAFIMLACTALTWPVAAFAAEPEAESAAQSSAARDASVGEIIVTAQRREQSVMSVPIAISAVTGDNLAAKGITSSSNLQYAVPNLQISSPFGNAQPNFSLRGISVANEYNSNQASPIGVYMDDVYLASRTSHGMGLFDVDRIEVVRGPQGTLFGRNTTGGAINFITRAPALSGNNGYVEAGYGNFNTFTAQGAAEATLVEDQLGLRVAANYVKGDGRIRNVYPGGLDAASQDTLQGRATLRYRSPDDRLDLRVKAYAGRDRPTQAATHGLLAFRTGLGFFEENEDNVGYNRTSGWGVSANLKYKFNDDLSATLITSRDGGRQTFEQSADGSPLRVLDIIYKSKFDQFSEEVRFNWSKGSVNAVGGFFYGWDRVETANDFGIGSLLGAGADGGFYQEYRQDRRSYALFAQSDFEVVNNLTLTLGARYTWDRIQYRDGFAYLYLGYIDTPQTPIATTVPCTTGIGTCPYDPAARYANDGRNNALTGRASLGYKFDDGTMLYASYNRGYRSGAFNGGSYTGSQGINFVNPERINAYELGFKGRFLDRRLALSAAAFYYDYSNQQLQDLRPGPVGILVNAPKSRVLGGEIEAQFRASDALFFNLSAGYLDTKYKKLVLQGADLAGNQLPFAPHWTLQGSVDVKLLRRDDGDVTFTPSVSYFSHQYFTPLNTINAPGTAQNNAELQQDGYAKVNATLAWRLNAITLKAWVNNIFNQKNYIYGIDLRGAGFPYNFKVPDMPRTWGGTVRYSF